MRKLFYLVPVGCASLVASPIMVYGTSYLSKSGSTDAYSHIKAFERLAQEGFYTPIYWGQTVVGFLMVRLHNLFGWDYLTMFALFSSLTVLAVSLVLFKVSGNVVSGTLVVTLALIAAQGVLSMYVISATFEMMNLFVFLPLAVWLASKGFKSSQVRYLIGSIVLFATVSLFHASGFYTVPTALATSGVLAIRRDFRASGFYCLIAVLSLLLICLFSTSGTFIPKAAVTNIISPGEVVVSTVYTPMTLSYIVCYLSPIVLILLPIGLVGVYILRKRVVLDSYTLMYLGAFVAVLVFSIVSRVSVDWVRSLFVLSTVLAMIAGMLLGAVAQPCLRRAGLESKEGQIV